MTNLYDANGIPDINAVRRAFPHHGNGRVRHTTTLGDTFTFDMQWNGSGYDAFILGGPSYGSRDRSLHATHRLQAGNDMMKVCFMKPPPDLPTAVCLSMWWADCTSRYIATGQAFQ
jgi:hypothetical protein